MNSSNVRLLGLFSDDENASQTTPSSIHSRAMFKAAIVLAQQYNITIDGKPLGWQVGQTGGDVMNALRDACQTVSNATTAGIVGPALSREAHIVAQFSKKIGIPLASYSATDPDLSDRTTYPTFYRTVPPDSTAAAAILKLFIRFNWTSCIIIYQNDAFGFGGAKVISTVFIDYRLSVENLIAFDVVTEKIQGNLKDLLINSATRIVVVWATSSSTLSILQNALATDVLGPQFTWILSTRISFSSFKDQDYPKLVGMLLIEPVTGANVNAPINSTLLNDALALWEQYEPETFPNSTQIDIYGLFSFDATWLLIQALRTLCSPLNNVSSTCLSVTESSLCFDRRFVHSQILLDSVSHTKFIGVSGPIEFSPNFTDRTNGYYYSIRNVQLSANNLNFVSVLDYSDDIGWKQSLGNNLIIWPGISLIQASDRPKLKDVTLRICILEAPPFTIVKTISDNNGQNTTKYEGFIPDLIEKLQQLLGFNPDIRLASSNQTYSQFIKTVPQGIYDIIIGDVTITSNRREYVDFSNPIFDNSLRLIIRKTSDSSVDLLSFLRPFSRNLWLLVLGACIYAGALICLAERQDNEALRDRSIFSQLTMSVWYAFGNLVGYGVDFNVNTGAGRLVTAGLYILGIILVASYTANLASDLTISKMQYIVSSVDDLKTGKVPPNRVGIRVGTASEEFYLREISGGLRNYVPLRNRQAIYDYLLAETIDVALIDGSVVEYMVNSIYCNLTLIGPDYDKNSYGIVMQKDWIYAQELDVAILSMRESGALNELRKKWFDVTNCLGTSETSTATATTIESISGLFVTFAVITILSLAFMFWTKRQELKNRFLLLINRKPVFHKQELIENVSNTSSEQSATLPIISYL